jgi:putative nucleotidyltransferase with HDIG domain
MEQEQVKRFRAWFDDYVAGFYGDDKFINANIKLKEEHSKRVCDEMEYLADELGLDENQKRIAEVIAILHDIGRFEQFVKYRTYHDPRSVNHCVLGVDVLKRAKILEGVEKEEKELIEKAIEYHGMMELRGGLDGDCLLFSKLIRDADKIDIFYVVTDYYRQYRDDPEGFELEVELPDEPGYSAEVVEAVLRGERVDYGRLRNWNDMKILQLGWVYDVNFAAALRRIKERGFLEMIVEFLPKTGDIEKVRKRVLEYVDSRIEGEALEK